MHNVSFALSHERYIAREDILTGLWSWRWEGWLSLREAVHASEGALGEPGGGLGSVARKPGPEDTLASAGVTGSVLEQSRYLV